MGGKMSRKMPSTMKTLGVIDLMKPHKKISFVDS